MRRIVLIACCLWIAAPGASAQETDETPGPQPLSEALRAQFDERLADIAAQRADIERLVGRLTEEQSLQADIESARIDAIWVAVFDDTVKLAQDVTAQQDNGVDVSQYTETLRPDLERLPEEANDAMTHIASKVEYPGSDLTPSELVVRDQRLLRATLEVDAIFASVINYLTVAERFGLDATEERVFLTQSLSDSVENRSIFLQLSLDDVAVFRAAAQVLPTDAELPARLSAAEARIRLASRALQNVVRMMNLLDLNSRQYRQQILTATGEITTDVLDVGIAANLAKEWSLALARMTASEGPRLLFRLLLFVAILFLFSYLAKIVQSLVARGLDSTNVSMTALLRKMIVSSAKNVIIIIGILIALSQLGISLGPLLAGVGIAGFIIGFALQDSLANFASGMMILFYRPFDVGDFVEAGGIKGKVSYMSLVNTTFMTFDNQKLIVPNNLIWQTVITNFTAQETRRVDLIFGISYSDDIEKAERILRDVVEAHAAVLDDPEPMIKVHELGDSSVNIIVRPWVKTQDYWTTYWDLTKAVKLRFDQEGITIPFPQRQVHVKGLESG